MILSFTGTRRGTTPAQILAAFNLIITAAPERFLHGGAVGADTEIDWLVAPWFWENGIGQNRLMMVMDDSDLPIGVYPSDTERQTHWTCAVPYGAIREVYDPLPPLKRNRIMARLCDRLIACPAEQYGEVVRSGTWMTVRHARTIGRPVTIVRPDGKVE